jgi:release factor glutamine methyltransferase
MTATIHDLMLRARARLERAGIDPTEAALDAELCVREALGGWDRGQLIANWRDEAPAGLAERVEPLVARREWREPTAYILGRREFWGLDFDVAPGVLIPRPETEFIVEQVLAIATRPESHIALTSPNPSIHPAGGRASRPLRIADIGTGSGCIAIAIAASLPTASVVAIDISAQALAVAARNVARHGVARRVSLVHASLLDSVEGLFDVIVSNPPYIPTTDMPALQPEILNYEPHLALEAGADGLDVIRQLVPLAADRLAAGGWLLFEFGAGQADGVRAMVEREPRLKLLGLREDLAGIPRTAVARRA